MGRAGIVLDIPVTMEIILEVIRDIVRDISQLWHTVTVYPPLVEGRWVTLLRQVSVNHVEDNEAPASISTKISFSIPRIESANLWASRTKGD